MQKTDRELLQAALFLIESGSRGGTAYDITEEIRVRLAEPGDKPVAWIAKDSGDDLLYWDKQEAIDDGFAFVEPLYRHPRQPARLSDEEICEIAKTSRAVEGESMLPVTFARAIEKAIWEKNQ